MKHGKYDYEVFAFYYPTNADSHQNPIGNKRRVKIWSPKDINSVTVVEFVMSEGSELLPGDIKNVGVKVASEKFFLELITSDYKTYFGDLIGVRLGEIIGIITQ